MTVVTGINKCKLKGQKIQLKNARKSQVSIHHAWLPLLDFKRGLKAHRQQSSLRQAQKGHCLVPLRAELRLTR